MKPELSAKGRALVNQYRRMVAEGYERVDRIRVEDAFSDFEARAYREQLRPVLRKHGTRSLLDYGCGGSNWHQPGFDPESGQSAIEWFGLQQAFHYEPARDIDERRPVDCVLSFDVLEHIHVADVTAVLRDMFSLARKLLVLNIACYPAAARLPNGENAHVTVRSPAWWQGVVETLSMEYPDTAVFLMCSEAWRKSTAFPVWRAGDWLASESFVTPATRVDDGLARLASEYRKAPLNDDVGRRYALKLYEQGRSVEAVSIYQPIAARHPDNANDHFNLASLLLATEAFEEVLEASSVVIRLAPGHGPAYGVRGIACRELGRFEDAVTCFRRTVELDADDPQGWFHLANALDRAGQPVQAVTAYRRGLQLQPDNAEAHSLLSQVLLKLGQFAEGWVEYEWRLAVDQGLSVTKMDKPVWDGQPLDGRVLLLLPEQGLGDEIMFASCLPGTFQENDRVILCCNARLVPIFRRSFPRVDVRAQVENVFQIESGEFDCYLRIGSLAGIVRKALADFPRQNAYLAADEAAVQSWRARFAELPGSINIGISWRGGGTRSRRERRSLDLIEFATLHDARINFINLQYGEHREEIREFERQTGIALHHWPDVDPRVNLDDQGAQLAALDLLISVDNTTVHLAGALGVPCWLLTPAQGSDWRWGQPGREIPWYPSVTLQCRPGERPVAEFMAELREKLSDRFG